MTLAIITFCLSVGILLCLAHAEATRRRAKRAESILCKNLERVRLLEKRIGYAHDRVNVIHNRLWKVEHSGIQVQELNVIPRRIAS